MEMTKEEAPWAGDVFWRIRTHTADISVDMATVTEVRAIREICRAGDQYTTKVVAWIDVTDKNGKEVRGAPEKLDPPAWSKTKKDAAQREAKDIMSRIDGLYGALGAVEEIARGEK